MIVKDNAVACNNVSVPETHLALGDAGNRLVQKGWTSVVGYEGSSLRQDRFGFTSAAVPLSCDRRTISTSR